MKISCDIVRDLLPLYKDNVCSDASKDMVEDHLSGCENCRAYYEKMSAELPEITSGGEDAKQIERDRDLFERLARKLTFRQVMTAGAAALILLALYAVLTSSAPFMVLARERVAEAVPVLDKRISVDDVEVQDVYRLEDGSIYCSFTVNTYISSFDRQYVVEDKSSPEVDVSASGGNTNGISLQRYWSDFPKAEGYSSSFYFLVPEELTYYREDPVTAEEKLVRRTSDGVYFVGKGGEILPLYEEGDPISDAPGDIEELVQENRSAHETKESEGWMPSALYSENYCYVLSFNEKE